MKILLIGEFSNVHWTLAEEFRKEGHKVTVISSGDGWKNYKRDVDLKVNNKWQLLFFLLKSMLTRKFCGYDIVQLINYRFLVNDRNQFINKIVFKYLKRNNKKIFLAAYGDDFFYVKSCLNGNLRYSPFDSLKLPGSHYAEEVLNNLSTESEHVNKYIADNVDGIISCMYDYYVAYKEKYYNKLINIPLPINDEEHIDINQSVDEKINIFVGVQINRSSWKGTDIALKALIDIGKIYKDRVDIHVVENLPYQEYIKAYDRCHIFIDQLHSYSLGMNGLLALAKGKVVLGGAEPESYDIISEKINFPIVNVLPQEADVVRNLELLINDKALIEKLRKDSVRLIKEHHNSRLIAQKYLDFYSRS